MKDSTLLSSDFSIKLTRIFFSMNRKCKFHQRNFSASVKRPPTLGAAFSWKFYQVQRIFKNGRKDCAIFTDFSHRKQRSMRIFMDAPLAPAAVFFSSKLLAYFTNFIYFVANLRTFWYTFTRLNSTTMYQN